MDVLISCLLMIVDDDLVLNWQRDWLEGVEGVLKRLSPSGNNIDCPMKRPFMRLDIRVGCIKNVFLSQLATDINNNKRVLFELY